MRRVAALLLALPLIGCSMALQKLDQGKATLDGAAAARISAEVAEQLARDFPPGKTAWDIQGTPDCSVGNWIGRCPTGLARSARPL